MLFVPTYEYSIAEVIVYRFHFSTPPLYSFHSAAEARREKLTSATLPSNRAKTFYSQACFATPPIQTFVFQFLLLKSTVQIQYKYQCHLYVGT